MENHLFNSQPEVIGRWDRDRPETNRKPTENVLGLSVGVVRDAEAHSRVHIPLKKKKLSFFKTFFFFWETTGIRIRSIPSYIHHVRRERKFFWILSPKKYIRHWKSIEIKLYNTVYGRFFFGSIHTLFSFVHVVTQHSNPMRRYVVKIYYNLLPFPRD